MVLEAEAETGVLKRRLKMRMLLMANFLMELTK